MPIGQIIADRPPHRTVRAHLRIRLPWMSGEESQDLRLRQQPLRRVWAGNRQAAQRLAKEDGVSLNQWIAAAVAEKVGVVETAADFSKSGQARPPAKDS
jgi:hypothetical protein